MSNVTLAKVARPLFKSKTEKLKYKASQVISSAFQNSEVDDFKNRINAAESDSKGIDNKRKVNFEATLGIYT